MRGWTKGGCAPAPPPGTPAPSAGCPGASAGPCRGQRGARRRPRPPPSRTPPPLGPPSAPGLGQPTRRWCTRAACPGRQGPRAAAATARTCRKGGCSGREAGSQRRARSPPRWGGSRTARSGKPSPRCGPWSHGDAAPFPHGRRVADKIGPGAERRRRQPAVSVASHPAPPPDPPPACLRRPSQQGPCQAPADRHPGPRRRLRGRFPYRQHSPSRCQACQHPEWTPPAPNSTIGSMIPGCRATYADFRPSGSCCAARFWIHVDSMPKGPTLLT